MLVERRESFGWPGRVNAPSAPCRNGTVPHYDGNNQGLAKKKHSACVEYWKSTRKFHMGPRRGWNDIGYSFAICPHGRVMEGRGFGVAQAAQPGGNATWTSVTFMSGPDEEPTEKQIEAYRELRSWLRSEHGVGAAERPHLDFVSTSCPGPKILPLVRSGKLRAETKPSPPARPGKPAPTFPLPIGHWLGVEDSNSRNHSGFWTKDVKHINALRARLKERGWSISATGRFDKKLEATIKKFQAQKGIRIDGLVGVKTWRLIWEAPIT